MIHNVSYISLFIFFILNTLKICVHTADITSSILSVWKENGNFDGILKFGDGSGYTDLLRYVVESGEKYTIFSPDDEAVVQVDQSAIDISRLKVFLLNFVVYGNYSYGDLVKIGNGTLSVRKEDQVFSLVPTTSRDLVSLANFTVTVSYSDKKVSVNKALVKYPDLFVSRVSVHGIGSVYVLPSYPPPELQSSPSPPPHSIKNSGQIKRNLKYFAHQFLLFV